MARSKAPQQLDTVHLLVHPGFVMGGEVDPPSRTKLPAYTEYFRNLIKIVESVGPEDLLLFFAGESNPSKEVSGFSPFELFDVLKEQLAERAMSVPNHVYGNTTLFKRFVFQRWIRSLGFSVAPETQCRAYGEIFDACVLQHAAGFHESFDLYNPALVVLKHTDFKSYYMNQLLASMERAYLQKALEDCVLFRPPYSLEKHRVAYLLPDGSTVHAQ
ncbi:MAG: hypothetical protein WC777_05250 [Candidatus Gracilibacteria bacterium]|jgi:hypothetical protein